MIVDLMSLYSILNRRTQTKHRLVEKKMT